MRPPDWPWLDEWPSSGSTGGDQTLVDRWLTTVPDGDGWISTVVRRVPEAVFSTTGAVFFCYHLYHVVQSLPYPSVIVFTLVDALPLSIAALGVVSAVRVFTTEGVDPRDRLRITVWFLFGGTVGLVSGGVTLWQHALVSHHYGGNVLAVAAAGFPSLLAGHWYSVLALLTTLGATAGFWLGQANFFRLVVPLRRQRRAAQLFNRVLRHDIRNRAGSARGYVEMARERFERDGGAADVVGPLTRARESIDKLVHMANVTRRIERLDEEEPTPYPLDDAVREAAVAVREEFPDAEIRANLTAADTVYGGELLRVVFENLIHNGVVHNDATEPRVCVAVTTDERSCTVAVVDNGPGVPAAKRDHVFGRAEPDPISHGDGVGLYVVDRIVSAYGGDVWLSEDPDLGELGVAGEIADVGAVFVVRLRRASPD